jgi:hypothetical protein
MTDEIHELNVDDLAAASGGMYFDWPEQSSAGAQGKNIIDARGGQATVWGFNVTYDVNGKVSSVSRT